MRITEIVQVCHEAVRLVKKAAGDTSVPLWVDVPQPVRDARALKLLHLSTDVNATAKQVHAAWVDEQKKAGWKHGKEFNAGKKTDPALADFGKLPPKQQGEDELVLAITKALWNM